MNDDLTNLFAEVENFHWWFVGRRTIITSIIKKHITPEKKLRILDVGCGTGGTIKHLKSFGEVYGVDISELCVMHCKKSGIKNVQKASATKLPFKDSSFDVVLLLDVLEHVKKENVAMHEAKRVLKKGGVIILTLPALPIIWSEHDSMQGHVKRYVAKDLPKLAKDNSLKLSNVRYFNFIFSIPIIILRISSRYVFLKRFNKYESSVNLNISRHSKVNTLLSKIFHIDVSLSRYIPYPFGISLIGVFEKQTD